MIHPINISFPDEVMASPKRTLMELRKKSKITYLEDGRRLKDGCLLVPTSPKGLWNDFFLRSFVRRVGYDLNMSSESSSVDTLIDVVDLEPMRDSNSESESPTQGSHDWQDSCSNPDIEFDDSQQGQFNLSMKARLCRTNSGIVSDTRLQPILSPCCPSSSDMNEEKPYKEFLRFDFSHSNIFAQDLADSDSKRTVILLPNDYGKRICIAKSFDVSFNDSLSDFMKSMNSLKQMRSQLHFHIESVAISQDYLSLFIGIVNSRLTKELRLDTEIHVHVASGTEIGNCLHKIHKIVPICMSEENNFSINLEFDQAIKNVFINENEYLVVTMLGRVVSA
uniref:Checkpoint protein n=1 Tax=Acrobeloides nanus TaxID=290746 RepID=A0A914D2N4_9BILA